MHSGQFATLRNKVLIIEVSSNFNDFLQPKPPTFDYFSSENGQNGDFLGLKLLKNHSKFPKKNPLSLSAAN